MTWYNLLKFSSYVMTPQEIQWWSDYSLNMDFNSETEARSWIRDRLKHFNQTQGSVFGVDEKEDEFKEKNLPLYKVRNKWKIGKPINKNKIFNWNSIRITKNTIEELSTAGFILQDDVEKIGKVELINVNKLHNTDSNINFKNKEWILDFANKLKSEEVDYFKPVVYDANTFGLIDGHHRLEAVKNAKIKTIPAQSLLMR